MLRKIKGQSTAEYAIVIAVVIGALIAMQTYVKRGLQARYHDGIQFLSTETSDIGTNTQYEPYYLDSSYDYTRTRDVQETVGARGETDRDLVNDGEVTTRLTGGYQEYEDTTGAD